MDLTGQWIGFDQGDVKGTIVIDIDDFGQDRRGHIFFYPDATDIPGIYDTINFQKGKLPESLTFTPHLFEVGGGRPLSMEQAAELYPTASFPRQITVVLHRSNQGELHLKWRSDVGTSGKAKLLNRNFNAASKTTLKAKKMSWRAFKTFIDEGNSVGCVYRGQNDAWPLRTTFHRSKRSDLIPFVTGDVPKLYNALSGRLKHVYDLKNPTILASFWALAQHHGYPTPLLDWSRSPYVAAYFAFKNVTASSEGAVRIFVLQEHPFAHNGQIFFTTYSQPVVKLIEPMSLENERLIPQQSVLMISNVDDIEWLIETLEAEKNVQILQAIDIPKHEAAEVMKDLRLMGIGAGSLFPGIDGVCEGLREQLFPVN
ncbi:FRG domain-containing protein [Ponticaulis sp.]|uniref:FRG domain-containing protein n=1 Tax=Ponticaulis sp. TaxID=2020902 RepID=UPI002608340C|nr:FRG domain-containing protein [Ponticaulis sp.]MDF1680300.1 FRG domain-containing protein [Ponticaulis sp.]